MTTVSGGGGGGSDKLINKKRANSMVNCTCHFGAKALSASFPEGKKSPMLDRTWPGYPNNQYGFYFRNKYYICSLSRYR